MQGVEGMDKSRVISDDRMDARCLTVFYGYVRLAYVLVCEWCTGLRVRVAMHECGDERRQKSICPRTVCEGTNTCSVLYTMLMSRFRH